MRATNRSTFRQMTAVEEKMLRACMPKISATDDIGLKAQPKTTARRTFTMAKSLTFKLAEVR